MGVTNQRETTVLWERASGRPVANAIVWQSRITAPLCDRLKAAGHEPAVRAKTGLVLDAYFSASKIKHLLDTTDGLRARAARGEVLFGTVDAFLIWRLTGGRVHVTDESNASRTLLYNIHTRDWDDELLALFDVPRAMLPEVRSSSEVYGETDADLLGGAMPIAGAAGDQQAALFGQACFEPGTAKNTYGTGCFMLLNTGERPVASTKGLVTTVAWRLGSRTTYALEGSVFIAGAGVQWLRDGLRAITTSADVERLMQAVPDAGGVYLVPAFVGLGAPYWDPHARGTIVGLTRDTRVEHIARAAVDAMAYQTRDVLEVMQTEAGLHAAAPEGGRWCRRQRHAAAVPGRSARRAGAPAGGGRDHGAGRCLPGRAGRRLLGRPRRRAPQLGPRPRVLAGDERGDPRAGLSGVEESGHEGAGLGERGGLTAGPTARPAEFWPSTPRTSSGRPPYRAMARRHRL